MENIFDKITPDMKPLRTAIVHPVDENSLRGVFNAVTAKLIIPVLVGPEVKIRAAADKAGLDISKFELIPTEHSHAAAQKAADLARDGKVEALMKCDLASDEFLGPIVAKENNLRTDRRMSHVFRVMDPNYHKVYYVTDAAMNHPGLELSEKKDIVQNAIDLFRIVEGRAPKVAILAASEHVDPKQKATLDAAALMVMALHKQITGAKAVDGPLSFDLAVSKDSARVKGVESEVAGDADIFVFPDVESANIFVKSRMQFSGAKGAGIVVGARIEIILTSRFTDPEERIRSVEFALANARKKQQLKR
ncbi:MAG: bifunctional enoyl-CoA hydratase/phosphate acetyltransferase [Pseudomonadota bacterium]